MDSFKIKLYEQEYNKPFPSFKHLTIRECEVIKKKFFFDFQVDNDLKLVNEIRRKKFTSTISMQITNKILILKKIFQHLDKDVTFKVYINWFRFDNIDQMKFNDFSTYFYDIWFPSVDDIDLFDESYSWIVSIRHDGMIYVWNQDYFHIMKKVYYALYHVYEDVQANKDEEKFIGIFHSKESQTSY